MRTPLDPSTFAASAERVVHEIDPGLAVSGIEPLERTVSRSLAQRRFVMVLLGAFAALALILAVIGIHGLMSYSVARRRQEIGVRMALGAGRRTLVALFLREGTMVVAGGMLCGLLGAAMLSRLLRTLLFEVTASDPLTYLVVAVVLSGAAIAATVVPARRAARLDPGPAERVMTGIRRSPPAATRGSRSGARSAGYGGPP